MARARRQASGKSATDGGQELTCPECGKTFTRAASLGAHRNRAHGVAGTTKRSSGRRSGSRQASPTRRRGSRALAQSASPVAGTSRRQRRDGRTAVDRNHLLQALFPNGVPPREDVIARVGSWLDEAEQLARL